MELTKERQKEELSEEVDDVVEEFLVSINLDDTKDASNEINEWIDSSLDINIIEWQV